MVGYLVARHWCLPGFICDAIRYHHAIGELGMHDARSMVAILQLAVEIYYRYQHVANPEWEQINQGFDRNEGYLRSLRKDEAVLSGEKE